MVAVQIEKLSKSFGPVQVLRGVDLVLRAGEVHALMGENGAGKSTLMKVLSGTYPHGDYAGKILLDGKEARFHAPADAAAAGISIIHQELSAFPDLTVAENLVVGRWPKSGAVIDWATVQSKALSWFRENGITIDPESRMGDLSVGAQQLVEIAKALSRDARILILDEPTSSLSPQECQRLFLLIHKLKAQGKALVYISHRMEEIYAHCDQVTVLRDGQSVLTGPLSEIKESQVITAMVGRPLDRLFPEKPPPGQGAETLLELKDFAATEKKNGRVYGPLHFTLAKGEILGLSGLLGAGRSELMQAMLGDPRFGVSGTVKFRGREKRWRAPREAFADGIALVGEDRLRQSLLPNRSIEENSSVLRLCLKGISGGIQPHKEATNVLAELKKLRTNFHDSANLITTLSGGNQQKTIFSRVLQVSPSVVILDEPTRGVDVGAKYEIYQILLELTQSGLGILLVSSDLPELMALSDRVVVLSEGRLTGILGRQEIEESRIMALAVGRGGNA
jgi:ABC-type sugar transport system ATPase subunit